MIVTGSSAGGVGTSSSSFLCSFSLFNIDIIVQVHFTTPIILQVDFPPRMSLAHQWYGHSHCMHTH